jgi:plastocyanin
VKLILIRRWLAPAALILALAGIGPVITAAPAVAGGSCHGSATSAQGVAVYLSELCFGPTVLYAKRGATVTWRNKDSVNNTVTGLGFSWGSNGDLLQGDSYSYRFTTAGVYPYACVLHPGMVGAVVVGNAASEEAGAAILPAAPKGDSAAAARATARVPASSPSSVWRWITLATLSLLLVAAAFGVWRWQLHRRQVGIPG